MRSISWLSLENHNVLHGKFRHIAQYGQYVSVRQGTGMGGTYRSIGTPHLYGLVHTMSIARRCTGMVRIKPYQCTDTRYDRAYRQTGMYCPYRSLIGLVHIVHTRRYVVVPQTLLHGTLFFVCPKDWIQVMRTYSVVNFLGNSWLYIDHIELLIHYVFVFKLGRNFSFYINSYDLRKD